ncbi:hypothetical protein [Novosphingobium rosa]|uniref:hypothetical protein n=1 Tax=Novosphingobium rosa TaxID=76978 RepID=UPI000AADE5D5|nr:hypothetical protein [Novosphingobium rosa]
MDDQKLARHIERLEAVMSDLDAEGLRMPAIHVSAAVDALWKIANADHASAGPLARIA